ncbi:MAG: hypothetical protein H0W08_27720, partial [Acidobacteria bacterium]|nr:hypothetical protein [Acidobacteriota bacterium]
MRNDTRTLIAVFALLMTTIAVAGQNTSGTLPIPASRPPAAQPAFSAERLARIDRWLW